MVEIYVGSIQHLFKRLSVGFQLNNNAWFDQRFCDEITITAEMAYMIEKIEGGKYLGNDQFASKFESKIPISIKHLSTGCKTLLNCMAYPDIAFFAEECGKNALTEILKRSKAKICLLSGPVMIDEDIENSYTFYFLKSGDTIRCDRYLDVFKGGTRNGNYGSKGINA